MLTSTGDLKAHRALHQWRKSKVELTPFMGAAQSDAVVVQPSRYHRATGRGFQRAYQDHRARRSDELEVLRSYSR
jgi:hypothetical protein